MSRSVIRQDCIEQIIARLKRRGFISHEEIQFVKQSYDATWTASNIATTMKDVMWPIKVESVHGEGYVIHTH